jgi:EAL domain-containing protein (putative c-di-GMP-specific phosphodiesterase class I)
LTPFEHRLRLVKGRLISTLALGSLPAKLAVTTPQSHFTPLTSRCTRQSAMAAAHSGFSSKAWTTIFVRKLLSRLTSKRRSPRNTLNLIINHWLRFEQNRICGFEALARWNHPERGFVPPDLFIPLVEQLGLMPQLTSSILGQACRDAKRWPDDIFLSVNISPSELRDPLVSSRLGAILAQNGFAPNRLEVEITETALVSNIETAKSILTTLQSAGIKICLDDFGTGYSSLYHLRELKFDKVKIDRSFVQSMRNNPESERLVDAILGLTRSLNLPTVAEGIEDAAILLRLAAKGCEFGQGYYFGKAMTADDTKDALLEKDDHAKKNHGRPAGSVGSLASRARYLHRPCGPTSSSGTNPQLGRVCFITNPEWFASRLWHYTNFVCGQSSSLILGVVEVRCNGALEIETSVLTFNLFPRGHKFSSTNSMSLQVIDQGTVGRRMLHVQAPLRFGSRRSDAIASSVLTFIKGFIRYRQEPSGKWRHR